MSEFNAVESVEEVRLGQVETFVSLAAYENNVTDMPYHTSVEMLAERIARAQNGSKTDQIALLRRKHNSLRRLIKESNVLQDEDISPEEITIAVLTANADALEALAESTGERGVNHRYHANFNYKVSKALAKLREPDVADASDINNPHPRTGQPYSNAPESYVYEEERANLVRDLISFIKEDDSGFLSEREKTILSHRWGLDGSRAKTQREIGHIVGGVTYMRVQQLESHALYKLSTHDKFSLLREFISLEDADVVNIGLKDEPTRSPRLAHTASADGEQPPRTPYEARIRADPLFVPSPEKPAKLLASEDAIPKIEKLNALFLKKAGLPIDALVIEGEPVILPKFSLEDVEPSSSVQPEELVASLSSLALVGQLNRLLFENYASGVEGIVIDGVTYDLEEAVTKKIANAQKRSSQQSARQAAAKRPETKEQTKQPKAKKNKNTPKNKEAQQLTKYLADVAKVIHRQTGKKVDEIVLNGERVVLNPSEDAGIDFPEDL